MFHIFTHFEKKAALEKYADSLNKNNYSRSSGAEPKHLFQRYPAPHYRNCELENCGEDEPVTK